MIYPFSMDDALRRISDKDLAKAGLIRIQSREVLYEIRARVPGFCALATYCGRTGSIETHPGAVPYKVFQENTDGTYSETNISFWKTENGWETLVDTDYAEDRLGDALMGATEELYDTVSRSGHQKIAIAQRFSELNGPNKVSPVGSFPPPTCY